MIRGEKTERQYRAVPMNSSSSLKEFSMDRKKYFKKYILSEKVEDDETQAATMGRIVETLLMEPELFDERFYMSGIASAPTGLMLEFVEALYRLTAESTDENGIVTRNFEDLSREAYSLSGFKIKYDAVLNKFVGSDAEIYYNEIRQVRSRGLTVVTTEDVTNAERIVEELKTNEFTAPIVNMVTTDRYEVFKQFQIEGYEIDGMKLKSMIDLLIVDHEKKEVYIYDLKCIWAVEGFYENYYLYRRAYIQAYLYYMAVRSLNEFEDYVVHYPSFIVCDSVNYYSPLIYMLTEEDVHDAYKGFVNRGRTYPGVKEIISDLKWAMENDKWTISRKNYENRGVAFLK